MSLNRQSQEGTAPAYMDEADRKRIDDVLSEAMRGFLSARSVLICVGDPATPRQVATGTCVQFRSQHFVATAAHPFNGSDVEEIWVLHARSGYQARVPIQGFARAGGGDYDREDVALLHLSTESAASLGRRFVFVDEIEPNPADLGKKLVYVLGFPSAMVLRDPLPERDFHYGSISVCSLPVAEAGYPAQADAEIDFAFEYPAWGMAGSERLRRDLPNPGGYSGASIWILDPNLANPLSGIHNARWVGVQRAWLESSRVAYGNRASYWLALATDYLG